MEAQKLSLNLIDSSSFGTLTNGFFPKLMIGVTLLFCFKIAFLLIKCSIMIDKPKQHLPQQSYQEQIFYQTQFQKKQSDIERKIMMRNKLIDIIGRDKAIKQKQSEQKLELIRKKSNIANRIRFLQKQSLQRREDPVSSCSLIRSYPTISQKQMEGMKKKAQAYEHKSSKSLKYIL